MSTYKSPDPLDVTITTSLSDSTRLTILVSCWLKQYTLQEYRDQRHDYEPYFGHYERVCQTSGGDLVDLRHHHLVDAFNLITVQTHTNCINSLSKAWTHFPSTFQERRRKDEFIHAWICLTGRVLLLLNLENWAGDLTLKQYLETNVFTASTLPDKFRIPRSFTLRNLNCIGGLQIRWTNILSEHLMLEDENRRLAVFHHSKVLETLDSTGSIYPQGLMAEIKGLHGILLPRFDRKTRPWFEGEIRRMQKEDKDAIDCYNWPSRMLDASTKLLKSQPNPSNHCTIIDPDCAASRHLQPVDRNVDLFRFHKDRLVSVKEEYDHHEPITFMQYCRDTRKPARQWAFFIAMIVFVFGATQAATGIVQVYKAYNPASTGSNPPYNATLHCATDSTSSLLPIVCSITNT